MCVNVLINTKNIDKNINIYKKKGKKEKKIAWKLGPFVTLLTGNA
jgi:hypothetical protein